MKPAAHALIVAGVVLVLGAGAIFAFVAPLREVHHRSGNQFTILRMNLWGQPLWGTFTNSDSTGWAIMESGAFRHGQRNGRWTRIESSGNKSTPTDVWYLDGKEVAEAEWENRK